MAEGCWLRAEQQTGGRGRLGRTWLSPPGNLYCSTLVALRPGDPSAPSLAFVAGLAVHDTLTSLAGPGDQGRGMPRWLKWPNDVLIDGAKIAGILLERTGGHVVVGIGINVASAPELAGRPATCFHRLAGAEPVSAGGVLDRLVPAFAARLLAWRAGGLAATLAAWEDCAHPRGAALSVAGDDGLLAGTFAGLDAGGALRLALADGSLRIIHAGDVTLG